MFFLCPTPFSSEFAAKTEHAAALSENNELGGVNHTTPPSFKVKRGNVSEKRRKQRKRGTRQSGETSVLSGITITVECVSVSERAPPSLLDVLIAVRSY